MIRNDIVKVELGMACSMGEKCIAIKHYSENLKVWYGYEYTGVDGSLLLTCKIVLITGWDGVNWVNLADYRL